MPTTWRSLCFPVIAILLVGSAAGAEKDKRRRRSDGPGLVGDKPTSRRGGSDLVTLSVNCATPNAGIYIDGDLVGQTPLDLPLPVTPGEHSVKVTRLGFAPYIDVFNSRGKAEVRLDIELVPVAGVLHVKASVPEARVLVDGKYVGDAPIDVEADVGPRSVQVSKGGYTDFFQNVMAVAGQELSLDVHLVELPDAINPYKQKAAPPPRWYQKGWVWGVVAVAAVAVAGGAVGAYYGTRPYDLEGKSDFVYHAITLGR